MLNNNSLDFHCNIFEEISIFKKTQKNFFEKKIKKKKNFYDFLLAKNDLKFLKILGQFDKKFLIAFNLKNNQIVIFDQHAIHERILYEHYYNTILKYVSNEFFCEKKFTEKKFIRKKNLCTDENKENINININSTNNIDKVLQNKKSFDDANGNGNLLIDKKKIFLKRKIKTLEKIKILQNKYLNFEKNLQITEINYEKNKRKGIGEFNSNHNHIFSRYVLKKPIICEIGEIIIKFLSKRFDLNKINSIMNFDFIRDNFNKENLVLTSVPVIFDRILKDEFYKEIFFRTLVEIIRLYISEEKSRRLNNVIKNENVFISEFSLRLNHRILINAFLKIIKSRGCRDAIKFNDDMSFEFMNNLLLNLRNCDNPFLCAHGRRNFFVIIEN